MTRHGQVADSGETDAMTGAQATGPEGGERRVLVVDDDPHIREVISFALEKAGMAPLLAENGEEALEIAGRKEPCLVVLDITMPGMDGLDTCRALRAKSDVPVLFLSSKDDEIDRVVGLELGGDDYVTKPFSPRELIARINVILRRIQRGDEAPATPDASPEEPPEILTHGRVTLDLGSHEALGADHPIGLTATEVDLLAVLMRQPGRVRRREELMRLAYEGNIHVSNRTIDSHVRHIRHKFAERGVETVIDTVRGVGYRLGRCI